jgi:hypothetical protein
LVDLQLILCKSPASYFKQMAIAMPMTTLQRLKLSHITTRYKYLATFLMSCEDTLRSLTLDYVTLNDNDTLSKLSSMCDNLFKLREIVLQGLNVGNKGLCFGEFNKLRPLTHEADLLGSYLTHY